MSRIVVTGAAGQLGRELMTTARAAGHDVIGLVHRGPSGFDLGAPHTIGRAIAEAQPEIVIHAAAWTAVDDCEADPERADLVNGHGTAHVVEAADAVSAHVLYVSTDYVFDGTKTGPYQEDDAPAPRSAYGRSKLLGEQAVGPDHAIVRTSWLCGQHGSNVVRTVLRLAVTQDRMSFVDDQLGSPTFTSSLAPALLELALLRAAGTFHVTNAGSTTWYGFARDILSAAGLDPDRVDPVATADLLPRRRAPRPANSVLADTARHALGLTPLPPYQEPLQDLVARLRSA